MTPAFHIANRYFLAKKTRIVNLISLVSVLSIAVSSGAMIVILSVMNGMSSFVLSNFHAFDSDFKIELVQGRSFSQDKIPLSELQDKYQYVLPVLEEHALLQYTDQARIVKLKGVQTSPVYTQKLAENTQLGFVNLTENTQIPSVLLGAGVFQTMGIQLNDKEKILSLYMPAKGAHLSGIAMAQMYAPQIVCASGVFTTTPEYDNMYVIAPLSFVQSMLDSPNMLTSVEIGISNPKLEQKIQKEIQQIVGDDFVVKNRLQQNALVAQSMASEKLIIMGIFAFVLLIATFTMSASLMLLIYDKRKDIHILQSMGASRGFVQKIFFLEAMLISFVGAIVGLLMGALIAFMQQKFSLVKLNGGNTDFYIVDAYPIQMQMGDFFIVFVIVMLMGALASMIPLSRIKLHFMQLKP
ncbi:MAG: FtsX-like permease family protein [Bacteroidales bacterium]